MNVIDMGIGTRLTAAVAAVILALLMVLWALA
jgi:hypothetical protein